MRAIVNPYSSEQAWCSEFFPKWSLCKLPLAGKPYCEYALDYLSAHGVERAQVCDCNYSHELHNSLCNGKRWPLEVQYLGTTLYKSVESMLKCNAGFIGDEPLVVFWGMVLPLEFSPEKPFGELSEADSNDSLEDGIYMFKDGRLFRCEMQLRRVYNIQSFFGQNFHMLEEPMGYVLPGYSAENGIYTGMNVAIGLETDISPDVMLCDNINIERGVRLADGVIVGENVWIDNGTELKHSIALNNTYVGKNMLFENKIISSGRIIDPISEAYIDDNSGMSMDMDNIGKIDLLRFFEYAIALVLSVVFFIPYLFFLPFKRLLEHSLWAYKCSTDRYPKCLKVLCGQAVLVKKSDEDSEFVFRASDCYSLMLDEDKKELDDMFYEHNRSAYFIVKIVIKGLVKRLFVNSLPVPSKNKLVLENPLACKKYRLLHDALPEISADIFARHLTKIASVVLGGGYGRGEGGVFIDNDGNERLYNDLDLFVFTIGADFKDKSAISSALVDVGKKWSDYLGIDVEFAFPKNVSEIRSVRTTLMFQELRRGYVVIYGHDVIYTHVPLLDSSRLPFIEGMRLLMNRGMGLLFAAEHLARHSSDYDFILRNMNKAVLGALDAMLIVNGRYRWKINERISEVRQLLEELHLPASYSEMYEKACGFKLHPNRVMPTEPFGQWYTLCRFWCDAVCICVNCKLDSSPAVMDTALQSISSLHDGTGIRNALRWLYRTHSLKEGFRILHHPIITVLSRLYNIMYKYRDNNGQLPECDAELRKLWGFFN